MFQGLSRIHIYSLKSCSLEWYCGGLGPLTPIQGLVAPLIFNSVNLPCTYEATYDLSLFSYSNASL